MSKKSKKGKTMALTDFLASEPKLVTVRESTWAAIVDEEEAQKKPIVVDMSGLPTAPRSAVDIDYTTIPNNPPFVAYVANLSFEIDDESLRRIFGDLNPKSARIIREGNRSRGVGLVEFETRENLIEALKRTDKEIYGRKIRINVSDKTDFHQTEGNRSNFGNRSNRMGEERPELAGKWKRNERKSDELSDDRPSHDFNRNRNEHGRSNFNSGPRSDYGFGYPRARDDRGNGGGGSRDQGPRHRYHDDGMDKPKYPRRSSDTNEQNTPNDDNREPPKERRRLNLQPRTKPLEEFQPSPGSSSSVNNVTVSPSISNTEDSPSMNEHFTNNSDEYHRQESHDTSDAGSAIEQSTTKPIAPSRGAGASIFGGAKPVDTAAKELEIERKLRELELANTETGKDQEEKGPSSRTSYPRNNDRDNYRTKRSSHENDRYNRDRRDDGRSNQGSDYHHKREYSGGRRYEDDDHQRRYNNSSRRDHESNRTGRYNHPTHSERDHHYRQRDRDSNEYNNQRRLSDENSQTKIQPRTILRRTVPVEDDSNKLQLSNKFCMLNDDVESPSNDE